MSNSDKNIDGRSLIPVMNGKETEELPVYLENTIFVTDQESPQPCVGIRTSKLKYFRSLDNPNDEIHLYDLVTDPLEENNIAEINTKLVNEMEQILVKIRKELDRKFESPELSNEDEKKIEAELKKLGYI